MNESGVTFVNDLAGINCIAVDTSVLHLGGISDWKYRKFNFAVVTNNFISVDCGVWQNFKMKM